MAEWVNPSEIRAKFSLSMSQMYQEEVPLYSDLLQLVGEVNEKILISQPKVLKQLTQTNELSRLNIERHGAIRLGTANELSTLRRVFAVMGMSAVGYYDLTTAGVPVHSTVFRATKAKDLNISPLRVFASLLRLELIDDEELRQLAIETLEKRKIFTEKALSLTAKAERDGGLNDMDAFFFVKEVIETFRWHKEAPVTADFYNRLNDQHRLIADIVSFKGPHINHLTPRTLDIDLAQKSMRAKGIKSKAVIEGPPKRKCPILLRQTSFKALEERISFTGNDEQKQGKHTTRFGEIEQRGCALTPKGRELYDKLLNKTRTETGTPTEANAERYMKVLEENFQQFPDSWLEMQEQKLGFFHYLPCEKAPKGYYQFSDLANLIHQGFVKIEPIVYEDFLPVSAAGIFQSNLGDKEAKQYDQSSNKELFEKALGAKVVDELSLYRETERQSIEDCLNKLKP